MVHLNFRSLIFVNECYPKSVSMPTNYGCVQATVEEDSHDCDAFKAGHINYFLRFSHFEIFRINYPVTILVLEEAFDALHACFGRLN